MRLYHVVAQDGLSALPVQARDAHEAFTAAQDNEAWRVQGLRPVSIKVLGVMPGDLSGRSRAFTETREVVTNPKKGRFS